MVYLYGVSDVCFLYRDMAPEGSTLEESNRNLDEVTDLALQLQSQTGVRVLWVTCNLFAHQRSLFYDSTQEKTRVKLNVMPT